MEFWKKYPSANRSYIHFKESHDEEDDYVEIIDVL